MRKLLLTLWFVALVLISPSYLYGCGGEGSGDNPDSDMFGDLILGTLKFNNFKPENQDYIPKEILNIHIPTAQEVENEKRKEEIEGHMRYQEGVAQSEITMGKVQTVKEYLGEGVVLAAGLGLAVLAGPAGLAVGGAALVGAGFSAATSVVQDAQEGKSGKEILSDAAKAALQSAALGAALPNNPISGGLADAALAKVPNTSKVSKHMDGLKDYGPGQVNLRNGTTVMK